MAYSIDLSGRVAFVTGASSGLGAQFAKTLARAGAAVVLASRNTDRLKELRARIEGEGGDAHVVELDVTDLASIKAAVARAETEVGPIDVLVNNSGVSHTRRLQDVSVDDYDFIFDTNVKGSFFVAQEVGKRMLARAQGSAPGTYVGGRIINIASVAARVPLPGGADYNVSKAGVEMLTKVLAMELVGHGIRVNAIGPGFIETPMTQGMRNDPEGRQMMMAMTPMGRLGKPLEIANTAVFLASDESSYFTGQTLFPSGGMMV